LVQIDRDDDMPERQQPDKEPVSVLAVLTSATFLRGSKEPDFPHTFLDLKPQILKRGSRGGQQFLIVLRVEETGLHGPIGAAFRRELKQFRRLRLLHATLKQDQQPHEKNNGRV